MGPLHSPSRSQSNICRHGSSGLPSTLDKVEVPVIDGLSFRPFESRVLPPRLGGAGPCCLSLSFSRRGGTSVLYLSVSSFLLSVFLRPCLSDLFSAITTSGHDLLPDVGSRIKMDYYWDSGFLRFTKWFQRIDQDCNSPRRGSLE